MHDFKHISITRNELNLPQMPGVRPGGRACCLARPKGRNHCCGGKGPKTIDAPPGLIEWDGRSLRKGGLTRFAQTRPAR